jgi:hypothetical protein
MKLNYFTIHKNKKPKKAKYSNPYSKLQFQKMKECTQYFINEIQKLKTNMDKDKTIPTLSQTTVSGSVTASELRIGNFIQKRDDMCVLASINTDETIRIYNDNKTDTYGCFCLRIFNSIPITDEWLMKLGFSTTRDNFYRKNESIMIEILFHDKGILVTSQSVSLNQIKYVHQLQNLYFALTGFELQLVE